MSTMRSASANIPRGSTIVKAQLKISPLSMQPADQLDERLQAEATGNRADFIVDTRYLYDLPRTDASAAWVWGLGPCADQIWVPSPDIRDVVQEVIYRQDWSAGNALTILFSCTSQLGQDLQFLVAGYCDEDPCHWDESKYPPSALEVTYLP